MGKGEHGGARVVELLGKLRKVRRELLEVSEVAAFPVSFEPQVSVKVIREDVQGKRPSGHAGRVRKVGVQDVEDTTKVCVAPCYVNRNVSFTQLVLEPLAQLGLPTASFTDDEPDAVTLKGFGALQELQDVMLTDELPILEADAVVGGEDAVHWGVGEGEDAFVLLPGFGGEDRLDSVRVNGRPHGAPSGVPC